MPQYFFNSRRRSTRNKSNDTRKILVMPCGLVFYKYQLHFNVRPHNCVTSVIEASVSQCSVDKDPC